MKDKLLSGRFILTVIVGLVFAYGVISGKLAVDKTMEVILVVIYAYFTRSDRKPNGGT